MHKLTLAAVLLLAVHGVHAEENLGSEAQALVQQYVGQLKPALKSAMESGGPINAVSVCAERAPAIAQSLSASSGWDVRRVSLKPRNTGAAEPDAWARSILETFDARAAAGESPATLVHSEQTGNTFRFIKAQPVEPLCLVCHGESISPNVHAAIKRFYPDDVATGYKPGELRGAFYLTKALNAAE